MAELNYKVLFYGMVDDLVGQRGIDEACDYLFYSIEIQDLHEKLHFQIETITRMMEDMDEEEREDRVSPDDMLWLEQKIKEQRVVE